MLNDIFEKSKVNAPFKKLEYQQYYDMDYIKSQEWLNVIIGEDTDDEFIPFIVNLSDCLLYYSEKMPQGKRGNLELIEDLGVQYRVYNDASGGRFGVGDYRTFFIERT